MRRVRAGQVQRVGGYDGEYGTISLFRAGEREELNGQMSLPVPTQAPAESPGLYFKNERLPEKQSRPCRLERSMTGSRKPLKASACGRRDRGPRYRKDQNTGFAFYI